jgi:hypothetical protein
MFQIGIKETEYSLTFLLISVLEQTGKLHGTGSLWWMKYSL